jgi:hypothetical protein
MKKMGWIMFILDTGVIAEGRYQQELKDTHGYGYHI